MCHSVQFIATHILVLNVSELSEHDRAVTPLTTHHGIVELVRTQIILGLISSNKSTLNKNFR